MIGVNENTKMIKDFLKNLNEKFNRETQMIEFPITIKNIVAEDAEFEFFTSNFL